MFNDALTLGLRTLLYGYVAVVAIGSLAGPLPDFDESIPLVHGALVQQGRTPHLDFAFFYPPLGLYLNAGAFSLLGRTVIASRAVGIVLYFVLLFLTYRLFRSWFWHSRSLVPAAMLVVAASIGSTLNSAPWPGFAISFIALLTYLCGQSEVRHARWIIGVSGILTGLALLYRVNFGAYAAAVIVGDLLLRHSQWNRGRLKSTVLDLAAYTGPLVACSVGLCALIYGNDIATGVYQFTVNTQRVMLQRGFIALYFDTRLVFAILLPLGWFSFRIVQGKEELSPKALIPVAFALVLLGVALAGRNSPEIGIIVVALQVVSVLLLHALVFRLDRPELSIVLFYCCLVHYYLSRADWFHWRILPVVESILLAFLALSRSEKKEESVSKGTSLAVLLSAACLLMTAVDFRPAPGHLRNGIQIIGDVVLHPHLSDSDRILGPNAPGAAWASVYPDDDELQALRYVRAITSGTDPIFVGVKDHSRVYNSNLRFYWLADRPIGARVFQLETRVASEAPVQREIIADFERNGVKCVIIDREPIRGDPTFIKSGYVGSTLLDEYISSHFREEGRFGRFSVLTR